MEIRTETSSPSRENFRNTFKIQEGGVLSALPAHVWIHGRDNSVLYSNLLKSDQDSQRPKRCYDCFKGRNQPCSCCKSKQVRTTLCPEGCECKRNGNIFNVYHFPYLDDDNLIQVIKFEIDVTDVNAVQNRSMTPLKRERTNSAFLNPPNEFLGICASCKKIRDDSKGKWVQNEVYMRDNYNIDFSHGICPTCAMELYPNIFPGHPADGCKKN